VERLCNTFGITQHFTIAYSPWSNGSVERVNRDIKSLLKILMTKNNDPWENWYFFLPAVMRILNEAPRKWLKDHAPKEIFMGFTSFNPLYAVFKQTEKKYVSIDVEYNIKNNKQEEHFIYYKENIRKRKHKKRKYYFLNYPISRRG